MKVFALSTALLLGMAVGTSAGAATPAQPPMNDFNYAYYSCDGGGAFQMNYPSKKPETATLVTSNNSKSHEMKRTKAASGVSFAGDGVTFTTDGQTVTVTGTEASLQNCKKTG